MLLEVIAETVEDACEAEQGGAGRIELVRDLDRQGLTPSPSLIAAVLKAVSIPVRVMLRDSEPFEMTDRTEPARLHDAARTALASGASGFVVGFLRAGAPDLAALDVTLGSIDAAVTFHRAFDETTDPIGALLTLSREPRIDRVLTSGGGGDWKARLARLHTLREAAPSAIHILPGGGIDAAAVRDLARAGFTEAHVGRAARADTARGSGVRAGRVAALLAAAASAADC